MNILITGVAGLLGSRLSQWIIENKPEYSVIGIDDLSGGYIENVHSKVQLLNINLVNKNDLTEIFEKYKPCYVFSFCCLCS